MMVHYILKNFGGDLSSALSAKGVFIKTNFPDAWDYAKAHACEKHRMLFEWHKRMEEEK